MNRHTRKLALITGASRGIGRATAIALAEDGWDLVINYAGGRDAAEQTRSLVVGAGSAASLIQADVSRPADLDRLFATIREDFGRLDLLVNNAGVSGTALLDTLDEASLSKPIDVNIKGTLLASQRAVRAFDGNGGSIINVSSALVHQPIATQVVYAATKAAIEAITRTLAQELGAQRIRVNAVAPGPTQTDLLQIDDGTRGYLTQRTALGRIGTPVDIARVVAFLASGRAGWVTGQVVGVDGGLRL